MVTLCRQGFLFFCLLLLVSGCSGAPPAATQPPTPTGITSAVPQPTPEVPVWPAGVLFYELEEPEQTCLGYQEHLSFNDTISQIKIVCTQAGIETVYFIDTENQTVTVLRIPIPLTSKPQE